MSSILDAVRKSASSKPGSGEDGPGEFRDPGPGDPGGGDGRGQGGGLGRWGSAAVVVFLGLAIGAFAARFAGPPEPEVEDLLTDRVASRLSSRDASPAAAGEPRSQEEQPKLRRKDRAAEERVASPRKKQPPVAGPEVVAPAPQLAVVEPPSAEAPLPAEAPPTDAGVPPPVAPEVAPAVTAKKRVVVAGEAAPAPSAESPAPSAELPEVVLVDPSGDTADEVVDAAPSPPTVGRSTTDTTLPEPELAGDDPEALDIDEPVVTEVAPAMRDPRPVLDEKPPGAPEVTIFFVAWARQPGQRLVSLRVGAGALSVVRQGEFVDGLQVAVIHPEAVDFVWTGRTYRVPVRAF